MTLEIKGQIKNIHFLVDTSSPRIFICKEVINSYNLSITDPKGPISVRLNKRQILALLEVSEEVIPSSFALRPIFQSNYNSHLIVE
ncbi:4537_t:CDS:2 [Rhizophagus irregularis]|nr:4537_t:CDS:2 [Rhizophagus irregularis]